jgi:hypothetical protein
LQERAGRESESSSPVAESVPTHVVEVGIADVLWQRLAEQVSHGVFVDWCECVEGEKTCQGSDQVFGAVIPYLGDSFIAVRFEDAYP